MGNFCTAGPSLEHVEAECARSAAAKANKKRHGQHTIAIAGAGEA
jgi:hypothetical protein